MRAFVCAPDRFDQGQVAPMSAHGVERPAHVAICVCTFRRPQGLRALLEGLSEQSFVAIPAPRMRVIVIDNEPAAAARAACMAVAEERGLDLHYLMESCRGISFARNRGLDAVPADVDFIAMIDDDERPEPDWLEELLRMQATTRADVVQGRVLPAFADDAPDWIVRGGFFGYPLPPSPFTRSAWADGQALSSAATGNVLIRGAAVAAQGLRFDPRLALTGGEDALFFRTLKGAGCRIVYAQQAVVHEDVPAERARLGYLLRRAYRNGSKRLAAKLWLRPARPMQAGRMRLRLAVRAMGQGLRAVGWLFGQIARGRTDPALLAHGLIEMAAAAGTLAACVGLRYAHYGGAGDGRGDDTGA